jgi:hypothetical protein
MKQRKDARHRASFALMRTEGPLRKPPWQDFFRAKTETFHKLEQGAFSMRLPNRSSNNKKAT